MNDLSWLLRLPLEQQQAYFQGPALEPPPGVEPNFTNPPNRNDMGYVVLILCPTIVTIFVSLQLYSRIIYHRKFAVEDGITIAAVAAYAAFLYFVWAMLLDVGVFIHQWNIRLEGLPHVLYLVSAGSVTYGIVLMLLKVSILMQWANIFVPTRIHDYFWWTCHITLWINVLFYVICTFLEVFGCSPRQRIWTPWLEGKCLNIATTNIVSSFINFFSDLIILLLPQMVIWKLNMSFERKFGTAAVFAVGLFVMVCAGMRIKSCFVFANEPDTSYNVSALGFWCVGEMTAGFLVLCLPALPKLFKSSPWFQRFFAALRSISRSSRSGHSHRAKCGDDNCNLTRSKPRRPPDASLFTDSHLSQHSFVPLKEMSTAKSNVLENGSWLPTETSE